MEAISRTVRSAAPRGTVAELLISMGGSPRGGSTGGGVLAVHCDTMMELCGTVETQEVFQELADNCRKAENRRKGRQ